MSGENLLWMRDGRENGGKEEISEGTRVLNEIS